MNKLQNYTFTVPIDGKMIKLAQQLSREQHQPDKARDVYLNTLAVLAVHFYCECIGIQSEFEASSCFETFTPSLINTAGLFIRGKGMLECRPVITGTKFCYIPAEVAFDTIGYVIVEIDEVNNQACLLGFIQSCEVETLPIDELCSLQYFLTYLYTFKKDLINLRTWFDGLFYAGWQQEMSLTKAKGMTTTNITEEKLVTGVKIIRLMPLSQSVLLILRQTKLNLNQIEIFLRIYPADESIFLPDGINIKLLDGDGQAIPQLEKQAKASNWLQLQFIADIGDKFGLQISFGEESIAESFVI